MNAQQEPSKQLVKQVGGLVERWRDCPPLASRGDYDSAAAALKAVKQTLKIAEAEKDSIVKPINAGLKIVRAKYDAVAKPLGELEGHLKSRILEFENAEQAARQKEAEKAAAKAEKKGNAQFAIDLREAAAKPAVTTAGFERRTVRRAVVTDRMAFFTAAAMGTIDDPIIVRMLEGCAPVLNTLLRAGLKLPPGVTVEEETILAVGSGA